MSFLLPDDFDFQDAQVTCASGRTETAIAASNEYGTNGDSACAATRRWA